MKKYIVMGILLSMFSLLSSCAMIIPTQSTSADNQADKKYAINEIVGIPTNEYPVLIEAHFNDEYEGSCQINDQETIIEIMGILNNRNYTFYELNEDYHIAPGTNRALALVYADGSRYEFSTRTIKTNDGFYEPSYRDNIDAIIQECGLDSGSINAR